MRRFHMDDLSRVVIGIDPATTSGEDSDETGIIVAGRTRDGFGLVIDDLSGRYTPNEWARKADWAFYRYRCDRIVAETNQGGDMVVFTIRTVNPKLPVTKVHAKRGKWTRAEPVVSLYEQGKVFHAKPFPELEDQMCTFVPGVTSVSPDRVDALVYALSDLLLGRHASAGMSWV